MVQFYFGLYESKPYCFANSADLFATSAPLTYATIYRSHVWGDLLIALANMGRERGETALELRAPRALGIRPEADYLLFDVLQRAARSFKGRALSGAFKTISIPAQSLQLFCLRPLPAQGAYHLWGGKRISEEWNAGRRKLTLVVQGPAGVQETLFFGGVQQGIERVEVNGKTQPFFFDPAQGLVHGNVTFSVPPLRVEVLDSPSAAHSLPQRQVTAGALAQALNAQP